jgi:hypothetical protein
MPNYEFIKSSNDIPQHGTFEIFSVKFNGKDLFYWSDNCGLVSSINYQEIEKIHPSVFPIYEKMEAAKEAANAIWYEKNRGYGDNPYTVYDREGRTDEFGVKWTEL